MSETSDQREGRLRTDLDELTAEIREVSEMVHRIFNELVAHVEVCDDCMTDQEALEHLRRVAEEYRTGAKS